MYKHCLAIHTQSGSAGTNEKEEDKQKKLAKCVGCKPLSCNKWLLCGWQVSRKHSQDRGALHFVHSGHKIGKQLKLYCPSQPHQTSFRFQLLLILTLLLGTQILHD